MTDYQRASDIVGEFADEETSDLKTLREIVDRNQNSETADDSFPEDRWYALRDLVKAWEALVRLREEFNQ